MAEPFPWTVIQGVTRDFIIINESVIKHQNGFTHANHPVRTTVGAMTTRIGRKRFEFNAITPNSAVLDDV